MNWGCAETARVWGLGFMGLGLRVPPFLCTEHGTYLDSQLPKILAFIPFWGLKAIFCGYVGGLGKLL